MASQQSSQAVLVPEESIERAIYLIRGKKVMLDRDLAALYGVQTGVFNQAVSRNSERFPEDFMFQLTPEEVKSLRSQIVILKTGKRGAHSKYLPHVFTEQGVAMLSSVLNSARAIQVNIQIMRTFTKLRELMQSRGELRRKIEAMEKKYDHQFHVVFDAIKKILAFHEVEKKKPKRMIGFHTRK